MDSPGRTPNVFVVTGPACVGKATAAGIVARSLEKSALLTGDTIYHFVVGGKIEAGTPGEPVLPYYDLLYRNLICLTENNLAFGNDVVIDYILDYRTTLSPSAMGYELPPLGIMRCLWRLRTRPDYATRSGPPPTAAGLAAWSIFPTSRGRVPWSM